MVSGAMPFFVASSVSALQAYSSTDTSGWVTDGGYGSVTAVGDHAIVDGVDAGPFTRFGGYKNAWPGEYTTKVDVYLDPAWADGSGFDYSVAANGTDGLHQRDFVFHVARDVSPGKLLVSASNNSGFAVRQDMGAMNPGEVTTAGWYTLQHKFYNNGGQLAVDLTLLGSGGAELFTTTLTSSEDLIPSVVGGNRYGWFTFVNVPGGLEVNNTRMDVTPVATVTLGATTMYYDSLQAAVAAAAPGSTIELYENVTLTQQLTIDKVVTVNGNGNWITGSFKKDGNSNNSVIGVQSSGVKISNLTVDAVNGDVNKLHGINVYASTGVELTNIVAQNGRSGVVVGQGSTVTIDGIETSGNVWHGINVDKPGAQLTIKGNNSHNDNGPAIFVDNKNDGKVFYEDAQYSMFESGNTQTYVLTTSLRSGADGTVALPASGGIATTPTNHPIEFSLGQTTVMIPKDTAITASNPAWDGTILAPTSSDYVVSGNNETGLALTVGSNQYSLTFEEPVKLVLAGQAGKRVGFVRAGENSFSEITAGCSANDETIIGTQLAGGYGECKINDDLGNLVIWTKHFTTFATFTPIPVVAVVVPLAQPAPTRTSTSFASIFDAASTATTNSSDKVGDVLGTQTTKKVAKSPAVEATNSGWKIYGLMWYWWVLIVAVLAAAVGYLAVRRRNAEN